MRDQQTNTTESNTACGSELHNSISQTTFKEKNMSANTLPATRFQAGVAPMAEERSLERLLSAVSTADMSPAVITAESQTTNTCWSLAGKKREVGIGGLGRYYCRHLPVSLLLLAEQFHVLTTATALSGLRALWHSEAFMV